MPFHTLYRMRAHEFVTLANRIHCNLAMANDGEVTCGEWLALPLRCQLSHRRLSDPARCEDCQHLAGCNYDELCEAGVGRTSVCPIVGCAAILRRRLLVRDTNLRDRLAGVAADVQTVWLRGDEMRTARPEELLPRRRRPQAEVKVDAAASHAVGASTTVVLEDEDDETVPPAAGDGEWKPAGLCGTPGCYLADFHAGLCTPFAVGGSRKRKAVERLIERLDVSCAGGSRDPRRAAAVVLSDEDDEDEGDSGEEEDEEEEIGDVGMTRGSSGHLTATEAWAAADAWSCCARQTV